MYKDCPIYILYLINYSFFFCKWNEFFSMLNIFGISANRPLFTEIQNTKIFFKRFERIKMGIENNEYILFLLLMSLKNSLVFY